LEIFEAFAVSMRPLTLTELAKALEVPLSSCLHIMRTLERRGYVYSLGPRQGYYPSMRMFRNAETIAKHDPLLRILAPKLAALRDRTRETIVLSQRVENQLVILDVYDSPQSIRYSADRGDTRPLYSTALGKALLGGLRPAERTKILDRIKLTAVTDTTITDRAALEKHLDESTERGWYRSDSENVAELFAIAINFRFGSDVFSIGVAGPYQRMVAAEAEHAATLLEFKPELGDLGAPHLDEDEE
jgi:DNA-binding IclR family transcriptional regulator